MHHHDKRGFGPTGKRNRRGVAAIEAAFLVPLILWVLLVMLDLGIAVVQYNTLADAGESICREAVIRGSDVPEPIVAWGPDVFEGTAADDAIVSDRNNLPLPMMPPQSVRIRIEWIDGDNRPNDRVRVDARFEHQSLMPMLMPWGDLELRACSVMPIVN